MKLGGRIVSGREPARGAGSIGRASRAGTPLNGASEMAVSMAGSPPMGMGLPRSSGLRTTAPTDPSHLDSLPVPVLQSMVFDGEEPLLGCKGIKTAPDKRNYPETVKVFMNNQEFVLPHLHQGVSCTRWALGMCSR